MMKAPSLILGFGLYLVLIKRLLFSPSHPTPSISFGNLGHSSFGLSFFHPFQTIHFSISNSTIPPHGQRALNRSNFFRTTDFAYYFTISFTLSQFHVKSTTTQQPHKTLHLLPRPRIPRSLRSRSKVAPLH